MARSIGLALGIVACTLISDGKAAEFTPYGDALLRYENGFDYESLSKRERIRFIGHLGLKTQFSSAWMLDTRLSTGIKNKQNVPAITLVRLNNQSLPPKDIFFDRIYFAYQGQKLSAKVGKIPWSIKRNTDMFWDADLHPFGAHVKYAVDEKSYAEGGVLKPLDGQSETVGILSYLSYTQRIQADDITWTFSPWLVDFKGERGARYATRDTEVDNRSARLAITAKWQSYQLGLDFGHVMNDLAVGQAYEDEKTAWALQLRHGKLKVAGDALTQLKLMHVEQHGVIAEFAQNGTSRFATANFEGVEFIYRRMLTDNWWLGTRYSYTRTLVGPQEKGNRFRIETKYAF